VSHQGSGWVVVVVVSGGSIVVGDSIRVVVVLSAAISGCSRSVRKIVASHGFYR
jgi:hypothetical protein